jgi:ketosteroid isomerase-like protein
MSGTVAAPIEVEGQRLDAPGTRVEVDFVDVIAVADGLLARKDSYLDGLAFQQQMEAAS